MYWATSFCEREKSSKRERIYAERAWREGAVAVASADERELTDCFIGRRLFRRRPVAFLQELELRSP
jgi:hypothetical protein